MSDKGKLYTLALSILLAVGFIGFGMFLGYQFADASKKIHHLPDGGKVMDTIVIEKHDTIRLQRFDTITEQVTRYKLVQVDFHDTIIRNDTTFVELPFTQKHYHEDSVCDIWISGYDPQLDSANIICRERTIIEKYYLQEENRKNTIGLYAGQNSSGCMYIRSINNFQIGALAGYKYDKSGIDVGVVVGYKF